MAKLSAGILVYRWLARSPGSGDAKRLEVFLVHPGGPFWKNKDAGSWTIPKGEYASGEEALCAARREFIEETGFNLPNFNPPSLNLPNQEFKPLGELKQPSGKIISAWAFEGDFPADELKSNLFSMEWPPRSSKMQEFPEVDRAAWFDFEAARKKLIGGQLGFLDRLVDMLESENAR